MILRSFSPMRHLVMLAALALISALVPFGSALAQTSLDAPAELSLPDAPSSGAASFPEPQTLHITILDGEDALNNIRERTAREPIVQVEDENHKPVAGALVLFTIHSGSSGAGGAFGQLATLSVQTGLDGRAVAHGLQLNQIAGSYTIEVTATLGTLTTQAVIHQRIGQTSGSTDQQSQNEPATVTRTHWYNKATTRPTLIISGVVAGAVTAIVLIVHTHDTTITAGAGHVGP